MPSLLDFAFAFGCSGLRSVLDTLGCSCGRFLFGLLKFCFFKFIGWNCVDDLDGFLGRWHGVAVSVEFVFVLEVLNVILAFVLVLLAIIDHMVVASAIWALHVDWHSVSRLKEGSLRVYLLSVDLNGNRILGKVSNHARELHHLIGELLVILLELMVLLERRHLLWYTVDREVDLCARAPMVGLSCPRNARLSSHLRLLLLLLLHHVLPQKLLILLLCHPLCFTEFHLVEFPSVHTLSIIYLLIFILHHLGSHLLEAL